MNLREFRPTRQGKAILKQYGYKNHGSKYGMALLYVLLIAVLLLWFMFFGFLVRSWITRMIVGCVIFAAIIVVVLIGNLRKRGIAMTDYVVRLDDTAVFLPEIPTDRIQTVFPILFAAIWRVRKLSFT